MINRYSTFIRDISWLKFNERVLQEAQDASNALYDRVRFLGIYSNNQDEFFRVRVAALSRMASLNKSTRMQLEHNPKAILKQINEIVLQQTEIFDKTYQSILKELEKEKIYLKNESELTDEQEAFITRFFIEEVRPIIIPVMIESIPKLPFIQDNKIYLAVLLESNVQMNHQYALIEIPTEQLSRFIELPSPKGEFHFILIEDIIRFNLSYIFRPLGFQNYSSYTIKITRDAEFDLSQEEINAKETLINALKSRKKGKATRFVYDRNIPGHFFHYLVQKLNMSKEDTIIAGGRIHNFKDFIHFPKHPFSKKNIHQFPDGFLPNYLQPPIQIMDEIRKRDIFLNFPYHSFEGVIDLLREAAIDPFVKEIQISIYRLAENSKILHALINASRNGKQVTAILELRARFDEEKNIHWKEKLEEEGVKVFIGTNDFKVHAKLVLIKRIQNTIQESFAIFSTGNFNENTAKTYADFCIFTSNNKIAKEIEIVFDYLKNPDSGIKKLKKNKIIITSPFFARNYFIKQINNEIKSAKKGNYAEIVIKLNSLTDEKLIQKLHEAADSGVKLKLIIRGVCCMIPQGFGKENIQITSIVDHYLEHARAFVFYNNGKRKVYISSSDWMVRNLDYRVETTLRILEPEIQHDIITLLETQLNDTVKSRMIDENQQNIYIHSDKKSIRSQKEIFNYLKNKNELLSK